MKYMYIVMIFTLFAVGCKSDEPKVSTLVNGELNWLTIEQAQELQGNTDKLFLVDVYTDWCGWCKVMDKKTFTDEGIKKYLDENFYVVKFNAEQKEPITFNGKEYLWRSGGRRGVNTLAIEMLNGRLGYPSLVFLDSNLKKIKVVPGYKTPDQLMDVIKDVKAVL